MTLHVQRCAQPGQTAPQKALQPYTQVLARIGAAADGSAPCSSKAWGFAALPPLAALLQDAEASADGGHNAHAAASSAASGVASSSQDRGGSNPPPFVSLILEDHAFRSQHSTAAMARAYGLASQLDALTGSLVGGSQPDEQACAALRQRIHGAWSLEALRRGVVAAKSGEECRDEGGCRERHGRLVGWVLASPAGTLFTLLAQLCLSSACVCAGDYKEAHRCYDKAIQLDPGSSDAWVARGAAFANQQRFDQALTSFQAALQFEPGNANAAKYLEAVAQRQQQQQQQAAVEREEQQRLRQQQQQQTQQPPPQQQEQQPHTNEHTQHATRTSDGTSHGRSQQEALPHPASASGGADDERRRRRSESSSPSSSGSSSRSSSSDGERLGQGRGDAICLLVLQLSRPAATHA